MKHKYDFFNIVGLSTEIKDKRERNDKVIEVFRKKMKIEIKQEETNNEKTSKNRKHYQNWTEDNKD